MPTGERSSGCLDPSWPMYSFSACYLAISKSKLVLHILLSKKEQQATEGKWAEDITKRPAEKVGNRKELLDCERIKKGAAIHSANE